LCREGWPKNGDAVEKLHKRVKINSKIGGKKAFAPLLKKSEDFGDPEKMRATICRFVKALESLNDIRLKQLTITALCFLFSLAVDAQVAAPATTPVQEVIRLNESSFDFGKIPQGKPVTHVFEVFNISNQPIALESVQASCGCTTPEWSQDQIPPGGAQKITVGYNSATEGVFEKSITIFYHKGQTKQIIIKGEVWKTPGQSAPRNNSIAVIKNLN
jgi:hypothetical protein